MEKFFQDEKHKNCTFEEIFAGLCLDRARSEDEAYEYFCAFADKHIGTQITAIAAFDGEAADNKLLFRSRIRAIYRASVWGQFSLLCSGAISSGDISEIAESLKDVFCELESEGREFNGFIKKGVIIDTPLLLYRFPSYARFDFLCIDLERICAMCTGKNLGSGYSSEIIKDVTHLFDANPSSEIALKVSSGAIISETQKMLSERNIDRVYVWK